MPFFPTYVVGGCNKYTYTVHTLHVHSCHLLAFCLLHVLTQEKDPRKLGKRGTISSASKIHCLFLSLTCSVGVGLEGIHPPFPTPPNQLVCMCRETNLPFPSKLLRGDGRGTMHSKVLLPSSLFQMKLRE